jgi:rhodanese-related sulfurtransferase
MNNLFENKGFYSNEVLNVTPRDTVELCKNGAFILDVREAYLNRFKMLDVPEIIYCPKSILAENIENIPMNKPLILVDATGIHSKEAFLFLKAKGFTNIANLAGGIVEWERDGLPIVIDKSERLSGSCLCQLKPWEKK